MMNTLTPLEEEKRAEGMRLRAAKARAGKAKAQERERWEKFKTYRKGTRCRCKIERGMTQDDLIEVNLRGRADERYNCAEPYYTCPVLIYAIELAEGGPL